MARNKKRKTKFRTIVMKRRKSSRGARGAYQFVPDFGATKRRATATPRSGIKLNSLAKVGLATAGFMFIQAALLYVFQSFNLNIPKVQVVVPLVIYWLAIKGHLSFLEGLASVAAAQFWNTLILTTPSLQNLFKFSGMAAPQGAYQFLPNPVGAIVQPRSAPTTRSQRIASLAQMNIPRPTQNFRGMDSYQMAI